MSNLLASLVSSAGALDTYNRVLEVTQNNVANANTPGYARQSLQLRALPFDPQGGLTGGVRTSELQSARNDYAERGVRRQELGLGREQQNVNSLAALESLFDISGNGGLPKALNSAFEAFSAWGANPSNASVRQTVIARAGDVARAFQQTAANFDSLTSDTNQQIRETVDAVNRIVGEIRGYNEDAMKGSSNDAGLDARIHASLEELSQYVDVTAIAQPDHSTTILLDGQVALLIGDRQHALSTDLYEPTDSSVIYPDAPPRARVTAADGTDITAHLTDGQLGALLDMRNKVLPSYIGDSTQPGSLNIMAKQFATRVNDLLTQRVVSQEPPAVAGSPLFTFDATDDTNVAKSLAIDSSVTPDQLAAIDPGPPAVSNGIPLALAALAAPIQDADKVDGVSFSEFYGNMAGKAGALLEEARNGQQVQQSLVAQAKDLREQLSGISLDEEATILMQFQRGYQAISKLITVLDQLSETAINIIR
jgi:flagellar hook-associated protein 1 FlgK